jgi:translation initiation factor 2D
LANFTLLQSYRAVEKALQPPEEALDLLLPPKAGDLELAKLPAPSRITIYLLDKIPVIIDVSSKGDFVPTVFGLWQAPQLLPQLTLKHPAVSQYIMGGADLMLPGVDLALPGLPRFTKGSLVSISVPSNPSPIAVGYALMNSSDVTLTSHGKGKIVEVIQAYGDYLWADLGNRAAPNEGFLSEVVLPVGMDLSADDTQPTNLENEMAGMSVSTAKAAAVGGAHDSSSSGLREAAAAGEAEAVVEASSTSQQPMEELLELALLQVGSLELQSQLLVGNAGIAT